MRSKLSGRRHLKSFASGTASMFSSSASHYAWLAHHYGIATITIDLMTLSISPPEFDIKRNRFLARYCQESLMENIGRLQPPVAVTAAGLIARFGLEGYYRDDLGKEWLGTSSFTVSLTDDRGKEWQCTITSLRQIAQGDGFGDPNR